MSHEHENVTGPGPGLGPDMGFAVADSLGSVLPVLIVIVVVVGTALALVFAASSLERYKRFRGVLEAGRRLFVLFGYGVATLVPLALLGVPVYMLATAEPSTQVGIAKWAGVAVGGFLSVSGLGWLTEKWWRQVKQMHRRASDENKPDKVEASND